MLNTLKCVNKLKSRNHDHGRGFHENTNNISVAKYKNSNGVKLPKISSSLLESLDENQLGSQGNKFNKNRNCL